MTEESPAASDPKPELPPADFARIEEVRLDDLPDSVRKQAEGILSNDRILGIYRVPHADPHQKSWVLRIERPLRDDWNEIHTDRMIFLYDSKDNEITGMGSITRADLPEDDPGYDSTLNRPYVSSTETSSKFLTQGFGSRRLILMNELSRKWFGGPLNASPARADNATRTWESLERRGLAERYTRSDISRPQFRFKEGS